MANSSNDLTTLDFDTIKSNLKTYLSSQDIFKDYDFDGSNMSVLLDVLAYNTYNNAFYLNMIGSEMFLDSAQLRDSVVSHAKELNYTPRSYRSAYANVNITVTATDPEKTSITMPKGTSFTSRIGSRTYTFTTDQNIVIGGDNPTFTESNVLIYEGDYVVDSYVVNDSSPETYLLTNFTGDITSLTVDVIEDNGATTLSYSRATSLFDLDSTSQVFFVQPKSGSYEIIFGDGVIGRKPKDRSIISIEYRNCNGELPNGANAFTADGPIDGEDGVVITVNEQARDGAVEESISSIKFNAPRAFTTQERAVTADDYETLLLNEFPEINEVVAYGGEEANPPQYGRVIISVDLTDADKLPDSKKDQYYNFIKPRSPLAIDPVFKEPIYTYLEVISDVRYNINVTSKNESDIETLVLSSILDYNNTNLDGFRKTLRESKLTTQIDNADSSIISNSTDIRLIKRLTPVLSKPTNYTIDFGTALQTQSNDTIVNSGLFKYSGLDVRLEDNAGVMQIVSSTDGTLISDVGTVDYDTGLVNLVSFGPESYLGSYINLYAIPKDKDVASSRNVVLSIDERDISVNATQVRI
jgi:hypothetical protein